MVSSPDNGVLLCLLCHDWVEKNRDQARSEGWLLQKVSDVGVVGVSSYWGGGRLTWVSDAEVDVRDEAGDSTAPPASVGDLSDRPALLVTDEPDEVGLQLPDLSKAFDRVEDVVEVRRERSED